MSAFFLSLAVCALLSLATRDQMLVARLSDRLGRGVGLLCAIWIAAVLSSGVAAWCGSILAAMLDPRTEGLVAAGALVLGALALLLPRRPLPEEPTRSFGAIFFVLLLGQVLDPARLVIVALVLASSSAVPVAVGGALGSGIAASLAWKLGGAWEARTPLRAFRGTLASALLVSALLMGLAGRGAPDRLGQLRSAYFPMKPIALLFRWEANHSEKGNQHGPGRR